MFKWFIRNEWRETTRSSVWEQSLGMKITIGILLLIGIVYLIGIGFLIGAKFDNIFPDDDPIEKFNSFLIYGFAVGFVLRFFMQKVPVLTIQPYLHLPVKKSFLVHYVLNKSLLSFFNFIPIFIFLPFVFFQIAPWFTPLQTLGYILTIFFTVLSVNFFSIFFKRSLASNKWFAAVIAVLLIATAILDYYGFVSLSSFSENIFTEALNKPVWIIVPVAILILCYLMNYFHLIGKLYPEENVKFRSRSKVKKNISDIKYLKQFGKIGELIQLEIKLYLRNKRPKSTLIFAPLFLLYGLFFYPQEIYINMNIMLIFLGIFITSPVMLLYGQYILSWESNYFDGILSQNIDFYSYFKAKYVLMVSTSLIAFIITTPYVFFGIKILLVNFICFLFNIGISSLIILYLSTNNKKRLDISQGAAFNYQGVSGTQFLMSFPILLLPVLIFLPFWALGYPNAGFLTIGTIGLLGLLFHRIFLEKIVNKFISRKYIIAEGFRRKY